MSHYSQAHQRRMRQYRIDELTRRSQDALSAPRYLSWRACCAELVSLGYTDQAAEAVLRSRHTRWAADDSKARWGCATSADLRRHLERAGVTPASAAAELDEGPITFCARGYGVSWASDPVRGLAVTCQTKESAQNVAHELNVGRTTLHELHDAHTAAYEKDPNMRVPYVWPRALQYELDDYEAEARRKS